MSGIPLATNFNIKVNQVIDNRCAGLSTDNNAIAFKALGLQRYETDTDKWKYWNGSNFVSLAETYTQGTGVSISPSNQISIGQAVATTDDVEFKSLDLKKDYSSFPVDPFITFTDSQSGGVKAKIQVINEGTSGGEIKFYTKPDGGQLTERINISQTGILRIKTDGVGLQISTTDGTTEQSYLYNSIAGDKDFVIDANTGSSASKGISFRIGNDDKLRINANGNVGIGTNTAYHTLHVNGEIKCTNIYHDTLSTNTLKTRTKEYSFNLPYTNNWATFATISRNFNTSGWRSCMVEFCVAYSTSNGGGSGGGTYVGNFRYAFNSSSKVVYVAAISQIYNSGGYIGFQFVALTPSNGAGGVEVQIRNYRGDTQVVVVSMKITSLDFFTLS